MCNTVAFEIRYEQIAIRIGGDAVKRYAGGIVQQRNG